MLKYFLAYIFCSLAVTSVLAQQGSIERIKINGNEVVDEETYLYYISMKEGDPFDRKLALADFHTLWETGFLDDLELDVSDGERGKIVTFTLVERPRVRSVDFAGSEELKTKDILEKLTEEEAEVPVDSFYDPAKIVAAERVIRTMLLDKGLAEGSVSSRSEAFPDGGGVKVVFDIRDEQKQSIKSITFEGNDNLDNWQLRWGMKKTRENHSFSALMGGSSYTEEAYAEDIELVREIYLNNGFVNVSFGPPEISYKDGFARSFFFWKKPKRWVHLKIPVNEGNRHTVGNIEVEGGTVFPDEFITTFFKIEPGDVYNEGKIIKGLDTLRELYGSRGYVQFTGFPIKRPRVDEDVVDVTINLQEDKQYFVNKIDFKGNSTTRDKVIRREMWLNEQDVMNMELLKMSIQRINQLGYFRPIEEPEITPVEGSDSQLDIVLRVAEQNRNQFTFGGGVSGLEGAFINLGFSTTNFLGRGETASFHAQTGNRTRNFQIAITDPYFMDKNVTLGFDVFKRTMRLPEFTRDDTGATLIFGIPIKRFSRLFLNYNYSVIVTSDPDPDLVLTPYDIYNELTGMNLFLDPRFMGISGNFIQSKVTQSFMHNTTDHPIMPSRGNRYSLSFEYAGGPLGGTVNFYKPTVEGVWYVPVTKSTNFGFRAMVSWIQSHGGQEQFDYEQGVIDVEQTGIPFYERFFLGGENQIRGYDIRTVGPRDSQYRMFGGSKMMLYNIEYYIPVAGPLKAVLYFDAGQTWDENVAWNFDMVRSLRTSTGIEARFFVPMLNVPFRLIFAYNPHRDFFQSATSFRFGIGSTF